uniref:Uncharacterized protein n=1 Tax=Candidatus Methanophaga sp. ANME-1 ERB7 TaxID=2759913 RepID=A0A7G9ZBU8_9EURY|nr:hypothetical protein GBAFDLPJ_00026 [Methanosarcinales archaeon ANME-1 ERB7]
MHPQLFKREGGKSERVCSTKGGLCELFGYTTKMAGYAKKVRIYYVWRNSRDKELKMKLTI